MTVIAIEIYKYIYIIKYIYISSLRQTEQQQETWAFHWDMLTKIYLRSFALIYPKRSSSIKDKGTHQKVYNMNKQTVNLNLQPAKSQFQNCSPFQVSLVFSFPRHFLGCWGSTPVGRIDFQLHVAIGKLHNGRLIGRLRRWEWWVFASVCVLLPGVEPIKALVCGLKVCCLLDGHGWMLFS